MNVNKYPNNFNNATVSPPLNDPMIINGIIIRQSIIVILYNICCLLSEENKLDNIISKA